MFGVVSNDRRACANCRPTPSPTVDIESITSGTDCTLQGAAIATAFRSKVD